MKRLFKAKVDNDPDVFKCPIINTTEVIGYKLVNEYFVDNSGFGQDNEPAYTRNGFLSEVKEGLYYGITKVGQFQVYVGEFEKIHKPKKELLAELGIKYRHKIANNTYELHMSNGDRVIRLYNTDILTFRDDMIILNSGGYQTVTTKEHLNRFLPCGISVFQKDYGWYVNNNDVTIPFIDNMIITN